MQFKSAIAAIILATTVSAAPAAVPVDASAVVARAPQKSGTNMVGSIFQFGSDPRCRDLFWKHGACGLSTYHKYVDSNMPLVAVPGHIFNQWGASQNNKLCGKVITMKYKGVTQKAVVADQNVGGDFSIDMCLNMWKAFGGRDNDGSIIKPITWSIAV